MTTRLCDGKPKRTAGIAPLAAVLMIPLLAMLALSIDLGYVEECKTELQSAADAAALAGTQQLETSYLMWAATADSLQKSTIRTNAIASAKTSAKAYASANVAGGVSVTLNDSDITVGYLDATGTFNSSPATTIFPNSVQVTTRRDSSANGELALFFGPVVGMSTVPVTSSARATTYTGQINSFNTIPGTATHVLPMTYDQSHWNNFMATGQDPDGNVNTDGSGNPVLNIYPSVKYSGNFGELSLDDSHAGSSEINGWIDNGVDSSAIQTLKTNNLIPVSAHPANTWDWVGNPGMKASTVMEVNSYTGSIYFLPLYQAYDSDPNNYQAGTGNGSHYYYDIVGFVPVKIMPVDKSNKEIAVQPATYYDNTLVFDPTTIKPGGTSSSKSVSFIPAKLTK